MSIYYLGFYCINGKRDASLPASGVFLSIFESLGKIKRNEKVIAINFARTKSKLFQKREERIDKNLVYLQRPSFKLPHLDNFFSKLWLTFYLKRNIQRNDTLVVYHSLTYLKTVERFVRKRNPFFIINIEEFYTDIPDQTKISKKVERDYFTLGDACILSTESMINEPCLQKKPYAIIYGDYRDVSIPKKDTKNKGFIKLVYAGTLSTTKGGCLNAINAMQFLPNSYTLDILTTTNSKDFETKLKKARGNKKISFSGTKTGNDFLIYISQYDIGLATQESEQPFNKTSFPSKIVNYLKCGLTVVSTPSPSVMTGKIHKYLITSETDSPKDISQAILKATKTTTNGPEAIQKLKKEFEEQLADILPKN